MAKENYQKAYDLRSRVSAREQYAISAYYCNDVTGELGKANQIYELYAKAYPRNWVPHNNLGGTMQLRDDGRTPFPKFAKPFA